MDFENGVIVSWVSPQDLWLWNFQNQPIFKIAILRWENFFSPERRSKVVKFAKNDRLDALIVLARDEQFLFFPWKWSKGGTIGWFFAGWNPKIWLVFYLFITFSHLTRIIQPHIYIHRHILAPFMYYVSQFNIQLIPLTQSILDLQQSYLHENWSEFNQKSNGHIRLSLSCLV